MLCPSFFYIPAVNNDCLKLKAYVLLIAYFLMVIYVLFEAQQSLVTVCFVRAV